MKPYRNPPSAAAAGTPEAPPPGPCDDLLGALRVTLGSVPAPCALVDTQCRFLWANAALAAITGVPRADHAGRPVDAVLPRRLWEATAPLLRRALAGKDVRRIPLAGELPGSPGAAYTARLSFLPVRSGGEVVAVAAVVDDLTERVEAERRLRESEERFRILFHHSRDAVGISSGGRHVYVNPAYVAMYGFGAAADLIGTPVLDLVPPEGRPHIEDLIRRRALGEDVPRRYTARVRRADGSRFDIENRVTQYSWRGETYTLVIQRDISEEVEARRRLAEKHRQMVGILESATDGFVAYDREWRYTYVNREAERILKRTSAELLGRRAWEVFPAADDARDPLRAAALWAVAGQTHVSLESYYFAPSGLWIDVHLYPFADGLACSFQDVSVRRAADAARQEFDARQRAFVRDVLLSVTEGRLSLSGAPDELPPALPPVGQVVPVAGPEDVRAVRLCAHEAARRAGVTGDRWYDLETAVGEAAMNAFVHAGGGEASLHAGDGVVQAWIRDRGKGIAVEHLPRATLQKGFTTAGTLGHGFKMILECCDRVWLLTGENGTTVVLEQHREPPPPSLD